jgi:hypothetical protein
VAACEALKEELRYFPDHAEAGELLAKLSGDPPPQPLPDDPEFRELYAAIRPYTMVWPARLWSLWQRAREICASDLPGNFVECGVAAGGTSALLAAAIARHSKRPRRLFACDTFEGMPAPTEHDRHQGQNAEAAGWGAGTCAAPQDSLNAICTQLGVAHVVQPVRGFFAETLPSHRAEIGAVALLHMDGDWYESTRDILENLFDQVVPGGAIQIDDYGFWEGCRRAVTEFSEKRGAAFDLQPIDESGVWMTKP